MLDQRNLCRIADRRIVYEAVTCSQGNEITSPKTAGTLAWGFPGGFQSDEARRFGIDSENDDAGALLIADEQPFAGRIEDEVARPFDAFALRADECHLPGCRIDVEHRDTVVAAVGAVEPLAVRMHDDFSRSAGGPSQPAGSVLIV